MNKPIICHVGVRTWVGSSVIGAEHYYARMQSNREDSQELERTLTRETARELTKSDRRGDRSAPAYEAGDESTRFMSEESLKAEAKAKWRALFPTAEVLLVQDWGTLDPGEVLDANDPAKMERMNKLYRRAVELDFWENRDHEVEMKEISALWFDEIGLER